MRNQNSKICQKEADVLIIGAGPAGTTAAILLAREGLNVILADRFNFPREKICGDGLIADTFRALSRLGLKEHVLAHALEIDKLRIYAPNGSYVSVNGRFASIPRILFDDILRKSAVEAGATFISPYTLIEALEMDGVVHGARFRHSQDNTGMEMKAKFTLLATGANPKPLELFGVCQRKMPGAVAARSYFRCSEQTADKYQCFYISYDKTICPGYGWVFPGTGNTFNIGTGYFLDSKKKPPIRDLKKLWYRFIDLFHIAREIVCEAKQISSLKGALLRTAFTGARLNRPGLMVLGEAAGLTYSFSGEGIGKAMESGIIASEILLKYFKEKTTDFSGIDVLYRDTLREKMSARFQAYKKAQRWLSLPMLGDLICWRANAGRYVRKQIGGLIEETVDPKTIFSTIGILKALLF
ncbi:MAG: NAD(P)/FAD-dependent oxidoreductase [Candidatus Aminicenantes bacterium]|nr:MAG: NAD(P)/FAD-dependent oxidoreductase [Candidatus Aminicenantes bacterium]